MNVSSIGSSTLPTDALLAPVSAAPVVSPVTGDANTSVGFGGVADDTQAAASVQISKPGQVLSKLQSLAQTDPAKFKQLLTDAADKLRADAQREQGGASKALTALADKFQQAADTGDVSGLKPGGHHGHHGHKQDGDSPSKSALPSGSTAASAYGSAQAGPGDAFKQAISGVFEELSSELG